MKYRFAAIAAFVLLLFAAQAQEFRSPVTAAQSRPNGPAGTPTTNQLIAACNSEWLSMTLTSYERPAYLNSKQSVVEGLIYKIQFSATPSLLSREYVDGLFEQFVTNTFSDKACPGPSACGPAARVSAQCFVDQTLAGRAGCFRTPSMTVRAWDDGNTMGRQDPVCRSSAAPSALPNSAAKPAPRADTPAEKFPPARPAKMAPWSPEAMPIYPDQVLSPKYAAERADALASCISPIRQWSAFAGGTLEEAVLIFEESSLNDGYISRDAGGVSSRIENMERSAASGTLTPEVQAAMPGAICLARRRLAQLQGSPLISGAVDGTLTPLSIGGQTPAWKQQGKDARVIASDGKSAMHCVKLEQIASGDSKISGGGRRFFNYCPESVEIVWCHTPGECERERGAMWTVRSNYGWPISSEGNVRWAACLGANTAAHVKGTFGLRYYCSAPAKK